MAIMQDDGASVGERARRALQDNVQPMPRPSGEGADYTELISRRLGAIRLVRELGPKKECYGRQVRDFSRHLAELDGDSVHYRAVLEKLREAHEEWLRLEEKLLEAHYIVRSTQWLVDLLTAPGESDYRVEVASTHEA